MAIGKRGNTYWAKVYRDGSWDWVGTFATRREARDAERQALATAPTRGRETVAELVNRYVEDFNFGGTRWSAEHQRNITYALRRLTDRFGSEPLARFPVSEAAPWASRQPQSVLRAVRALFNDAVKAELTPRNPFAKLGLEQSRGRKDIVALTEEELHLLADCALAGCGSYGPVFRAFLLFQGYQGLRPVACTSHIEPSHIHGDELYLKRPGKGVDPRTVLLFPESVQALASFPHRLGSTYLFESPTGKRLRQTAVTYWWHKVRAVFEVKLDPRRQAELRDARPYPEMQPYELRHTGITLMLRRGISPEDVAHQVGHTDGGELVRTRYGHLTDRDRMDSVKRSIGSQAVSSTPSEAVEQAR